MARRRPSSLSLRKFLLISISFLLAVLTTFPFYMANLNREVKRAPVKEANGPPFFSERPTRLKNHGSQLIGGSEWPLIQDIIDWENDEVLRDPQFLLDFAILGHGKCGTTTLMDWLGEHPAIKVPEEEVLELVVGTKVQFINRLHSQLPPGPFKRGYKSPGDIRSPHAIRILDRFFPKVLLIVGIRHPILWFESLYNFKVQNLPRGKPANFWGDPNMLINKCQSYKDLACVGTAKALFHIHLAQLGKTNHTQQLQEKYPILGGNITQTRNPVLLFDLMQLSDTNSTRVQRFGEDLQRLLHLPEPALPPPPRSKPGKKWFKRLQRKRNRHKISICENRYLPVRNELLRISQEVSDWILHSGFLDHPDVHVSSRYYFEEIMTKYWMADPCNSTSSNATISQ